jgi:hypothetical protein
LVKGLKQEIGNLANSVAVPLQRDTANYSGQVSRCAPTAHYKRMWSWH